MPNAASAIVHQLSLITETIKAAVEEVECGQPYTNVRSVEFHPRHPHRLTVYFNDGSECHVAVSAPGLWDGSTQRWWEVDWPNPDYPIFKEKWETSDGMEWSHPDLAYQHQKGLDDGVQS